MANNLNGKASSEGFSLSDLKGTPIITFFLCFFVMVMSTADQALFSYAIPGIIDEFGITLEQIGLLLTYSFVIASVVLLFTGTISDKIGRRKMFVFLLCSSAFFVGLHSISESFSILSICRMLGFAIAAGLYPITLTIVIEVAPSRLRGMFGGLLQISYPMGFFLASLIAAPLIGDYGWRSIFYPAFLVIPLALLIGLKLKEPEVFTQLQKRNNDETKTLDKSFSYAISRIKELFSKTLISRTLICFFGTFFLSLAIGGITYFLPTFLVNDRGISQSLAAQISGLSYLIGAPGYIIASSVGEFITTRRNTVVLWAWLGSLAFVFTIWFAEGPLMLIFGFGLTVMFLFGTESVRMPLLGEIFPTHIRATATSIVGSIGVTFGWLIVPIVLTKLSPLIGWNMTWTLCAILPVLLSGFLFLALKNYPSGVDINKIE